MLVRYILLLFIFCVGVFALAQNVPPTISDPDQLETIRKERQAIFDELIEDPTNQGNLFTSNDTFRRMVLWVRKRNNVAYRQHYA